jgi:hypothetical protein
MDWRAIIAQEVGRAGTHIKSGAQAAASSRLVAQGARAAASLPTRELAIICGRAGAAHAMVEGVVGSYHAYRAMSEGQIDGKQAIIHTVSEAGSGFVTSSVGTAGTLAAYMITGTMGPIAIAAGMGAGAGARHIFRSIVGETLPPKQDG